MQRIDLTNKFFHGILTPGFIECEAKDKLALEKLKSILSSDKLYCIDSLVKNGFNSDFIPFGVEDFYNDTSEICLSVYPDIGKYSHCGDKLLIDSFSQFSARTFYLIFDEDILYDYSIKKGKLANEYYLKGDLPVSRYLKGIGNAGLDIKRNLKVVYYYFKYYNDEISFKEFLIYSGEMINTSNYESLYNLGKIENIAEVIDEMYWFEYPYVNGKEICELAVNSIDTYIIRASYYEQLKKIALKYNINLFDKNGLLIEEDNIFNKIDDMKDYVLEQLNNTSLERKKYLLNKYNKKHNF